MPKVIISPIEKFNHGNFNGANKNHRIFFALWPDDETRIHIAKSLKQLGKDKLNGRIIPSENIHITLHFIGNVSEQKLECLHNAAQTVVAKNFHFELDHFGYFYKPKILWLGLKENPEGLKTLHQVLGQALANCSYQVEHRPYAPHVTLMRKLTKPESLEKIFPIQWSAREFVLVESIPVEGGVRYEVRERYSIE